MSTGLLATFSERPGSTDSARTVTIPGLAPPGSETVAVPATSVVADFRVDQPLASCTSNAIGIPGVAGVIEAMNETSVSTGTEFVCGTNLNDHEIGVGDVEAGAEVPAELQPVVMTVNPIHTPTVVRRSDILTHSPSFLVANLMPP